MEEFYNIAPEVLASGFLTPPPYEGRRDSCVSAQSSYCHSYASSEYSAQADYSAAVPPPSRPSELGRDGYENINPYQQGSSHQALPWTSHQEIGNNDNVYDSFGMVPPANVFTRTAFSYNGYPNTRMFDETLGPQIGDREKLELANSGPGDNESMICWPDTIHNRAHNGFAASHLNGQVPMSRPDEFQSSWNPMAASSAGPMTTISDTIVPSDSLMVDTQPMDSSEIDSRRIEDAYPILRTPQEVSFRRSSSPMVKFEQLGSSPVINAAQPGEERPRRVGTRIIVRSTGAKGVKKESGKEAGPSGSKKKMQTSRFKKHFVRAQRCDQALEVRMEQGLVRDYTIGRVVREEGSRSKFPCNICGKRFQRPEHRKRHIRTHNPSVVATCTICGKEFGRNDNCRMHYDTHIKKPGRKECKNEKMSLSEARLRIKDEKIWERLWLKYGHLEEDSDITT